MKRVSLLAFFLTFGCTSSDRYLTPVPPPPPAPLRFAKNYRMDLNVSEKGSIDVDILWVIDNSQSMGSFQDNVKNNSDAFMRAFTASTSLHWRMGLISTTLRQPPFLGFNSVVDWNTPDAIGQFKWAVEQLGISGDSNEESFAPTLDVLRTYPNFLRPGAFLVQIIVSDELEDERDRSRVSVDSYLNQMAQLLGGADRLGIFGIFNPLGSNRPGNTKYQDVVDRTRGKTYNINDPNFGPLLAQLGVDLVARTSTVSPVILLDQKPKPDTIRVSYKGRLLKPGPKDRGGEWTYNPMYNLIQIEDPRLVDTAHLEMNVSFEIDEGSP